jgi:hypothetical protein
VPLSSPALLTADHDVSQFTCQHSSLTEWLQKRALENNAQRGSRTHVVCDDTRVVGFYALAAGSGLLQNAIYRALNAANDVGARILLCHAIDEAARKFYLKYSFIQSPVEELTVMLDLSKVRPLLQQAQEVALTG